ncbi:MAG: TrmH family RNA methyltransferase, partial [Casimicrobium sp.]
MSAEKGLRGYAAIGLVSPKKPVNMACVLRASGCYGASLVAASGIRYRHLSADTQRAYKHIPTILVDDLKAALPFDCVPIAVDLVADAKSLVSFVHPERAFYV